MSLHPNALNSVARTSLHDDPHTIVIRYMLRAVTSTALTSAVDIDDTDIIVDDVSGILVGHIVTIFNVNTERFYQGKILSISVNTLLMDTPLDSVFPAGSNVDISSDNINVDGSVTPVIFEARGGTPVDEALQVTFHINRLLIQMTTTAAPDLDKFGDISGGLTKGVVFRSVNGITNNIFNVKKNSDIAAIAFDYVPYNASNPGIGVYGISSRLTFSGQDKMGSVIAVGPGEDVHLIVQDDLTSLLTFKMVLEGHIGEFYR